MEKHRETKRKTFITSMKTSPAEVPSHTLFTNRLTHLYIATSLHPVNTDMYKQITDLREEFKNTHSGHDKLMDVGTLKCKGEEYESYLVSDDRDYLPFRFHSLTQWTFAILGLSLLYRLILFLSMGHLRYNIKKRIEGFQELFGADSADDHVFTVAGLTEPPPYTPPEEFPLHQRPPDYDTVVSQPKEEPPPYNAI